MWQTTALDVAQTAGDTTCRSCFMSFLSYGNAATLTLFPQPFLAMAPALVPHIALRLQADPCCFLCASLPNCLWLRWTVSATMSAPQKSDSNDLRAVQNAFQNMKMEPTKSTDEASKKSYTYNAERVLGSGSFGVVYQAVVVETGESVAIKKVFQDKRYKNRELQIMKELKHPNVVELKHAFYTSGDKPGETYLNVVMEYCSDTVYRVMKHYTKMKQPVPHIFVQIYSYQMARACAYIHAVGICHRDIKPQNLLVDGHTHALKICDFGSAKPLVKGEPNVAYICSRYYRAPELIFGATDYGFVIDIWSMACVSAELILGHPIFPGESGVDQLVEIIKVLGTPTREELMAMNPNYTELGDQLLEALCDCAQGEPYSEPYSEPSKLWEDAQCCATMEGVDLAQSALEDFINSYYMFHKLNPQNGDDVLKYSPFLGFMESHIYDLDQANEDFLHPEITRATRPKEDPFGPLRRVLKERTWMTSQLDKEFQQGARFWALERKICSAFRSDSPRISQEDAEEALRLKSFDYRAMNLLLYKMRGEEPCKEHMEFLATSEILVEIGDDLVDYYEDIERNSFNIYRCFVAIHGPESGATELRQYISRAEEAYAAAFAALQQLDGALAAKWLQRNQTSRRHSCGSEKPGGATWEIPPAVKEKGFKFPQIKPHPWHKAMCGVFRARTSADAVDYISKLLATSQAEPKLSQSCNKPLPEHLFHFSKEELALMDAELQRKLIPAWAAASCSLCCETCELHAVEQPSQVLEAAAQKPAQ
eukprot:Skav224102  [mRNA]  locus=scaffold4565:162510:169606:- [translate_table: standard]